MKIKERKVYHCDFCKKYGLRGATVLEHEKHCTANPKRVCGLCGRDCNEDSYDEEIAQIRDKHAWLMTMKGKDGAQEGILGTHCETFEDFVLKLLGDLECPPCSLAILRQTEEKSCMPYYNFKEEMTKYFEKKNKEEMEAEYKAMLYAGI